jgi:hypothetical protein
MKKKRPSKKARFVGTGVVARLLPAQRAYLARAVERAGGMKSQSDIFREAFEFYMQHHPEEPQN